MQLIRGKKYLKQIFGEWYDPFTKAHPGQVQRPSIPRNVEKMLKCGTEEMGFHLWQCSNCQYEKKVAHTCKSRFCSSCGVKQTDIWIARYTSLFANCQYQHVIFAPPHEFLNYFRSGRRKYFNCLYSVVNQTLTDWYTYVDYSKQYYFPGFMMVMHTFGRSLSWHVHIHVLITCGGLDSTQTRWVPCNFIPHEFLKWHFKQNFLRDIQTLWDNEEIAKIPKPLRVWFTAAYQQNIVAQVRKKKWFVHIGERLTDAKKVVRYIGRYTKRPAIAESKFLAYDGQCVTFTYQEHRMTQPEILTLPALAFVERVILHIPDVNFRIIRYGGFYANRVRGKLLPIVFTVCKNKESYQEVRERLQNIGSWWRKSIERYTHFDPLFCELCLIPLTLISVVYSTNRTDPYG